MKSQGAVASLPSVCYGALMMSSFSSACPCAHAVAANITAEKADISPLVRPASPAEHPAALHQTVSEAVEMGVVHVELGAWRTDPLVSTTPQAATELDISAGGQHSERGVGDGVHEISPARSMRDRSIEWPEGIPHWPVPESWGGGVWDHGCFKPPDAQVINSMLEDAYTPGLPEEEGWRARRRRLRLATEDSSVGGPYALNQSMSGGVWSEIPMRRRVSVRFGCDAC